MSLNPYRLDQSENGLSFEFYSEGPKGRIKKIIHFTKLNISGSVIYNLGFGDYNPSTGKIDDMVVSDNKDRDRVLATIANAVLLFFMRHPTARIAFKGSTPERTRLYTMQISRYLDKLNLKVAIMGLTAGGWEPFEKNKNYTVLLINKRIK
jgi:hypothetical protein